MEYTTLGAVDLGSNSFHLAVSRVVDDQLYPMDALKETVRLGSGLTAEKQLDAHTQERALAALKGFSERLAGESPRMPGRSCARPRARSASRSRSSRGVRKPVSSTSASCTRCRFRTITAW